MMNEAVRTVGRKSVVENVTLGNCINLSTEVSLGQSEMEKKEQGGSNYWVFHDRTFYRTGQSFECTIRTRALFHYFHIISHPLKTLGSSRAIWFSSVHGTETEASEKKH